MSRTRFMSLATALLGAASLQAQAPSPWDVGASLVLPLDGLKKVTHAGAFGGFIAEVGYHGLVNGTKLPFRASGSVNVLPGRQEGSVKSSLLGYQIAGDVFAPTGLDRLQLVVGLSLNRWTWDYQDPTGHTKSTMKGPKFGARLGFDWWMNKHLTATVLLQQTELGTDNRSSRAYNPSWLQVGATYRF